MISLIGVAWNVVTFFVVPVLLYEPVGVADGISDPRRCSGSDGETFIGNGAIGLVIFVACLAVLVVSVPLMALLPALGITVGLLGVGALAAIGAACTRVFNAALYRYATTGEASGAFTVEDLQRRSGRGSGAGCSAGPRRRALTGSPVADRPGRAIRC